MHYSTSPYLQYILTAGEGIGLLLLAHRTPGTFPKLSRGQRIVAQFQLIVDGADWEIRSVAVVEKQRGQGTGGRPSVQPSTASHESMLSWASC